MGKSGVVLLGHLALLLLPLPTTVWAHWADLVQLPVRTSQQHGQRVIPRDMDGDGDVDLICSYSLTDEVVLELNAGDGTTWQMVQIGGDIPAMFAAPADIDGDADLDIAAVGLFDRDLGFQNPGYVVWYERTGDVSGPWTRHDIDTTLIHARYLDLGDVDGDGDIDIAVVSNSQDASGQGFGNVALWYENLGGGASWSRWSIATGMNRPQSIRLADIDGDERLDAVAAEEGSGQVLWFANEGTPRRNGWPARAIASGLGAPSSARTYDLDGDGDRDVLVAAQDPGRVSWFEHPANVLSDFWPEHVVTADLQGARETVMADFNNDGRADIGAGSSDPTTGTDLFAAYESLASGGWAPHVYAYASFTAVEAADVDGDGDTDALTSSYADNRVDWWKNAHDSVPTPSPTATASQTATGTPTPTATPTNGAAVPVGGGGGSRAVLVAGAAGALLLSWRRRRQAAGLSSGPGR